MPNHVTNQIKASQKVLDVLKGENGLVDFNKIIPRPERFKGHEPDCKSIDESKKIIEQLNESGVDYYNIDWEQYCKASEVRFPKDVARCCDNIQKTGYAYWHEWCCGNWDTKWNAYDISEIDGGIQFNTAWSPPISIIEELAKMFPDEPIEFCWADEDFGHNVGRMDFLGETIKDYNIEYDSEEAHSLAMKLVHGGECPDYLRLVNGKYEYVEENECEGWYES